MEPESRHEMGGPSTAPERVSFVRSVGRYVAAHPLGVLQTIFFGLVAVVVLQNLEPTSLDVLFWSIPVLPKLVLVVVAMAIGGLIWEVLRRRLFRESTTSLRRGPS